MFNLEISRGGNRENKENAANSIRKSLVNRECQIKGYTQVYTHRSEIFINLNELYSSIKRQIRNKNSCCMWESLKYIRNLKRQEKIYQANTKKELINLDVLVGGMYGVWK